jgi:hypothetical protein
MSAPELLAEPLHVCHVPVAGEDTYIALAKGRYLLMGDGPDGTRVLARDTDPGVLYWWAVRMGAQPPGDAI